LKSISFCAAAILDQDVTPVTRDDTSVSSAEVEIGDGSLSVFHSSCKRLMRAPFFIGETIAPLIRVMASGGPCMVFTKGTRTKELIINIVRFENLQSDGISRNMLSTYLTTIYT